MPPVSEVEMAVPEEGAGGLSQSDVLCPICLEMFIEPVTLPCDHTLCKPCFLETVDKTSMCCPLCRKRVSTWARHHGRNKTLVNMDLWQRIQNAFPEQCQRRLSGQEVDSSTVLVTTPKVCQPGELRREYEDEVSKLETERRAQEEEERRASEEYIQRLLAEDEQLLEQQRRQQQESQEQDELLARQINQELNSDPVLQVNPQTVDITLSPKRPPVGGIQRFFGPVRNSLNTSDSSFASNMSTDTDLEMSIFPPERASSSASCDLPHLDYYGPSTAHPKRSIWSFQDHPSSPPGSPCSSSSSTSISFVSASVCDLTNLHSPERRSGSSIPGKRKSGVLEDDEEERENSGGGGAGGAALVLPPKRPAGAPSRLSVLQVLTRQEEELQERLRQEEEDLQLALRLQRQLEREERQMSAAAAITPYQLRQKTPQGKGKEEEGGTPGRRHRDGTSAVTPLGKAVEGGRRSSTGKGKAPRRSQSVPSAGSPPNTAAAAASPTTAAAAIGLVKVRKQATITELFQCQNS